ncbi:MAG: flagellar hook capping FlgD N-terminal domain-containing protein [Bdellovibrionales bacterium]
MLTVSSVSTADSALQAYRDKQASTIEADNTSSSSSSNTETSIAKTWGNFSTFLTILTTQLKNQDPTNATDTNQFTQELVQFAGVEQQLSTNSKLDTLINLQKSSSGATASLGYLNQYVETASDGKLELQGGASEIGYKLDSAMSDVSVTIKDSSGKTVRTLSGDATKGLHYLTWDGKDAYGNAVSDGSYSFSVSATGTDGIAETPSDVRVLGKVTGISTNTDGTTQLAVGGLSVKASEVDAVYASGSLPASST